MGKITLSGKDITKPFRKFGNPNKISKMNNPSKPSWTNEEYVMVSDPDKELSLPFNNNQNDYWLLDQGLSDYLINICKNTSLPLPRYIFENVQPTYYLDVLPLTTWLRANSQPIGTPLEITGFSRNDTYHAQATGFRIGNRKIIKLTATSGFGTNNGKSSSLQIPTSGWINDQTNLNDEHMIINGVNYGDRSFIALGDTNNETRNGYSQTNAYNEQAVKYGYWERKKSVSPLFVIPITHTTTHLLSAMKANPNISDLTSTFVLVANSGQGDFWVFGGESATRQLAYVSLRREKPNGEITMWVSSPDNNKTFTKVNFDDNTQNKLWYANNGDTEFWVKIANGGTNMLLVCKLVSGTVSAMYLLENKYKKFV